MGQIEVPRSPLLNNTRVELQFWLFHDKHAQINFSFELQVWLFYYKHA